MTFFVFLSPIFQQSTQKPPVRSHGLAQCIEHTAAATMHDRPIIHHPLDAAVIYFPGATRSYLLVSRTHYLDPPDSDSRAHATCGPCLILFLRHEDIIPNLLDWSIGSRPRTLCYSARIGIVGEGDYGGLGGEAQGYGGAGGGELVASGDQDPEGGGSDPHGGE